MKQNQLALITMVAIFLIVSGCTGGGGGSGRYTLPGEVPDPTGGTGGPGSGGDISGETNPDSLLASAWEDFRFGAFSSAISKFNQVLTISGITDTQRAEAYNGVGWAQAKSAGIESGYSSFTQAASLLDESRIGLAAALIQRGEKTGFSQAIQVLEQIGLNNTAHRFQAVHSIGVSNAEAHAMLAFAYFWRNGAGDIDKARAQITVARSEDGAADSPVAQIHKTLKELGLTGI